MDWRQRMPRLSAPWMAWWLAVALVLAPALGRMHEVLHAPPEVAASASSTPAYGAVNASLHSSVHSTSGVAAWFADHSALDCLVLDHLTQGHSSPVPLLVMGLGLPDGQVLWWGEIPDGPAVHPMFLARAPPERFMA